jgi:hypothetical protein
MMKQMIAVVEKGVELVGKIGDGKFFIHGH